MVSEGAEAVFRCRHPTADIIRWKVNGTLVSERNPPPDIMESTSSRVVDTLTITARLEYNGTEVVCVARFDDGSQEEQTLPAVLGGNKNALMCRNTSTVSLKIKQL